jgi:hypothetical protein
MLALAAGPLCFRDEAVCCGWKPCVFLPSGISSSPLSAEAMIAVLLK